MTELSQKQRLKQCEIGQESQELTIARLKQQIHSLLLTQHRLAEVINCVANRQIASCSFKNNELNVAIINEPEKMALAELDTHCPAIDGANIQ